MLWGISSNGRAPALHAGSTGIDTRILQDHEFRIDQADPGLARRVPVRSASSNYLCPRVVDFGSVFCLIAFSLWL